MRNDEVTKGRKKWTKGQGEERNPCRAARADKKTRDEMKKEDVKLIKKEIQERQRGGGDEGGVQERGGQMNRERRKGGRRSDLEINTNRRWA